MRKIFIATILFLVIPLSALASNLDSECQYFLRFLSNAVTPHFEYTVGTMLLYDLDDVRAYNISLSNNDEEHDIQVVFNKTKDGQGVSGYTAVFYIEDHLYDNDERFEQISNTIRSTLLNLLRVDNANDVYHRFIDRLNQYFYEESNKSYSHKHNGVMLTLEYLENDFLVLLTLD